MLTEQLINDLAENAGKVKPSSNPYGLFGRWTVYAAAYIFIAALFLGIRPDFMHTLQSPLFIAELLSLAGVIAASLFSAAILAFPDLYQKKRIALLPVPAFALFVIIMALAFSADNPPAPHPPHAMECLLCISLLSLPPGAFILFNIRRFASTHYYMAGVVATLAAFSTGAMALRLSERTDSISHLLEWHYLPMLGVSILGLLLGKLFLKW